MMWQKKTAGAATPSGEFKNYHNTSVPQICKNVKEEIFMIYSCNSSAAVSAMESHRLGEYPDEECEHISCECCGENGDNVKYYSTLDGTIMCRSCLVDWLMDEYWEAYKEVNGNG